MDTGVLITSLVVMAFGAVTLLFGRKLYWLFVGLGGFLLGLIITTTALASWNTIITLLIAAVVGVAFGALAIVARRPLAAMGSFAGIYFLVATLCGALGIPSPWSIILGLIGGVIAAVAVFILFDWGLIINSSLSGAGAVLAGLTALLPALNAWGGWPATVMLAVLAAAGVLFQAKSYQGSSIVSPPAGTPRRAG